MKEISLGNEHLVNQQTSQTPSPESSAFYMPEAEQDTPHIKISSNTEILKPDYYERLGFYCALATVVNPNTKLLEIIDEQKAQIEEHRKSVITFYSAKETRYTNKIEELKEKILNENNKLFDHLSELPYITQKWTEAESEKNQIERELTKKTIAFGEKKSFLLTEAIELIRKSMEGLIENQRIVYRKFFDAHQRNFEDNKSAHMFNIEHLEKIKQNVEKQWNGLILKMERLRLSGVNTAIANWLFSICLCIAAISGSYFFSISVLSLNIDDTNFTYFVLTGLKQFITDFYPEWSTGQRFLMLLTWFLGLSSVATLLIWLYWILFSFINFKDIPNVVQDQFKHVKSELNLELEISFGVKKGSWNFFKVWLQLLPFIIVLGGLISIAMLGTGQRILDSNNILLKCQHFEISVIGAIIGILLTFLVSLLSYFYIINAIESQTEQQKSNQSKKVNITFTLTIFSLLSLLSIFLLFFLDKYNRGRDNPQMLFLLYGLLVITNGFILGYALRVKGLFALINSLERKTLALANAIRNNSYPLLLNITAKENRAFQKEYFRLQREIFNLMLLKTQLGNQALRGKSPKIGLYDYLKKRLPSESFWKRVLFGMKINEAYNTQNTLVAKDISSFISIEEWEYRLFPAESTELEQIGKDIERARIRCYEIKEQMEALKEKRTPFCMVIQAELRKLEDSMDGMKISHEKVLFGKAHDLKLLMDLDISMQIQIQKGFHLGIYYRREIDPDFKLPVTEGAQTNEFVEISDNIPFVSGPPELTDSIKAQMLSGLLYLQESEEEEIDRLIDSSFKSNK